MVADMLLVVRQLMQVCGPKSNSESFRKRFDQQLASATFGRVAWGFSVPLPTSNVLVSCSQRRGPSRCSVVGKDHPVMTVHVLGIGSKPFAYRGQAIVGPATLIIVRSPRDCEARREHRDAGGASCTALCLLFGGSCLLRNPQYVYLSWLPRLCAV
jgi:hypothetical protein